MTSSTKIFMSIKFQTSCGKIFCFTVSDNAEEIRIFHRLVRVYQDHAALCFSLSFNTFFRGVSDWPLIAAPKNEMLSIGLISDKCFYLASLKLSEIVTIRVTRPILELVRQNNEMKCVKLFFSWLFLVAEQKEIF